MLMTTSQKYLMSLLKDFGAIKKSQAESLMKLNIPAQTYKNEIRQLILKNEITEQKEYLVDINGRINLSTIIAFDILLLISNKRLEKITKTSDLFDLTFFKFKKDKLWRYDICVVNYGTESKISATLENINSKYRIIIFVLDFPEQQKDLFVPCESCFVWKEKGEYHFYKEK